MIDIHPLFSTPVFISTPDEEATPHHNVLEYCKTLKYNLNIGQNWASEDTDILSNPVFKEIRVLIQHAIDQYTKNIMMWDNTEFYITQSWINVTPKDTEHHVHYHNNSIISGTFYLQTVSNDYIMFRHDKKSIIEFDRSSFNIWNSDTWKLNVSTNAIAIFPSSIYHNVEKHDENIDRVSIAFNVFFRGEVGSKEKLTYLKL